MLTMQTYTPDDTFEPGLGETWFHTNTPVLEANNRDIIVMMLSHMQNIQENIHIED